MEKKVDYRLRKIFLDKTSGSTELLKQINIYFLKNYDKVPDKLATISSIRKHFRSFQNIQQYLKQLELRIQSRQLSEKFFDEFKCMSETTFDRIFANSLTYLENKRSILTISNSKTVFEILRRLRTENCKLVTVSESRPKFEGRILAKKLVKENYKVRLITESLAVCYLKKCDCVLIGADTVLKNKDVVNKVGSLQLAVLSKYFKKPFYVVTNKSKFSSKNVFTQRKESPDEIWKNQSDKITIDNFYFEVIPSRLITKIITD